ncbi:unnamed protein product (macronuclear) [Paramecium tetraurelia]|uniref:Uncharacterized protein n=1 Tax=Paramecium tetraurelia TaxID=5888 RepID=A0E461_PARTE|nr:uncharacterized protein GSPATT00023252001 [Paramecium tetraurelia]CAK90078.1 unnamed protein product [Paramecium tetraurelia]|eukprot:XP_001457475.1 hypothetical protein (macronuclear) [Paramecium tetraurelia strain d4-2]
MYYIQIQIMQYILITISNNVLKQKQIIQCQIIVIMLGDCGVGKTTILNNFLDINGKTETTIGVQHHSFTRNNVKFSIWDTAGQEKYRSIVSSHYKRAKAAILVYDCSSESSLLHIDKWIEELVFQAGANVKIALIGVIGSKFQFWLEQNRLIKFRYK